MLSKMLLTVAEYAEEWQGYGNHGNKQLSFKTSCWFKIFICPCFRSVQIPLHGLHHGFQLVSKDPQGRFYRSLFQVSHCRPAMGLDLPHWIPYFLEDWIVYYLLLFFKTFYEDSMLLRARRNFLVRIPVKQTQCDVYFKPSEYVILPHLSEFIVAPPCQLKGPAEDLWFMFINSKCL